MKKIAFDIDGTVIDLYKSISDRLKKTHNIILSPEAFSRKTIEEVTNLSYEEVLNCVNECTKDIYNQISYPGAIQFIRNYSRISNGGEVLFVTNRWDVHNTYKLLDSYFGDIYYNLTCIVGSKVSELQKRKVDIFVEDRIENAEEISNAGIFTILLDRPWNQFGSKGSDKLVRVKDWTELRKVYEKMEGKIAW